MEEQEKTEENALLAWEVHDFAKHERKTGWFFWMTLLVGVLIMIALLGRNMFFESSNILFALILVIGIALIVYFELEGPKQRAVALRDDGIVLDGQLILYKELERFRIVYEPPEVKTLYLEFSAFWRPELGIALADQDPTVARDILSLYLEENMEDTDEPLADSIARWLKL